MARTSFIVKDASGRKAAGPFYAMGSATQRARELSLRKGGGWHVYRWRETAAGMSEAHVVTFVSGRRV